MSLIELFFSLEALSLSLGKLVSCIPSLSDLGSFTANQEGEDVPFEELENDANLHVKYRDNKWNYFLF